MALPMITWLVLAFLFAVFAHRFVDDHRAIDVDVTLTLGMTAALFFGALVNYWSGDHVWTLGVVPLLSSAAGALGGVVLGAFAQRHGSEAELGFVREEIAVEAGTADVERPSRPLV